jgi:hypothetical protein
MFKRTLHLLTALLVAFSLLGVVQSAQAFVYETTHLATCNTFGLWGTTNAPYVRVIVYNAQTNTSLLDEVRPTTGNGTLSVEVDFAAQPDGSILYYFVYGLNSSDPNDFDGEYWYELNDSYPCSGQDSPPEQLFASTTSRINKCSSFAATGISNAPYVGVEVKSATGAVLYRGKFATNAGNFSFNVPFTAQKKGKILEYRVWPSTTASVTPYDGSYGYYDQVACKL